jgi:hypothetical protein
MDRLQAERGQNSSNPAWQFNSSALPRKAALWKVESALYLCPAEISSFVSDWSMWLRTVICSSLLTVGRYRVKNESTSDLANNLLKIATPGMSDR